MPFKKPQLSFRDKLWLLLETPSSSNAAFYYGLIVDLFALLGVATSMAQTYKEYRSEPTTVLLGNIVTWFFMADIVLRFGSCPEKSKFFKDGYHVIDLLVLIPYCLMTTAKNMDDTSFLDFLQQGPMRVILTSQPIFRMLKVSRNFDSFGILVKALGMSVKSLAVPFFLLLFLTVLFGTLFYCAELGFNDNVSSIPDSIWWAIVTIATVGYGDMYPVTTAGMWCASILSFVGILYMAMPLSIVGSNYVQVWLNRKKLTLISRMQEQMRIMKLKAEDAHEAFKMFKEEGGQGLSLSEFSKMTEELNIKMTTDEKIESFKALDPEDAGVITLANFAKTIFPDKIWMDSELNDKANGGADSQVNVYDDESRLLNSEEVNQMVTVLVNDRLRVLEERVAALNLI